MHLSALRNVGFGCIDMNNGTLRPRSLESFFEWSVSPCGGRSNWKSAVVVVLSGIV